MPYDSKIRFINTYINKNRTLKTTKLDETIKGIINNLRTKKTDISTVLVDYLNIVRIIYFLKRVKYFKNSRFSNLNRKLEYK